jgi:hypothetical protein
MSRVGRYSRVQSTGDGAPSTTGLSPSAVCRSSTLRLTSVWPSELRARSSLWIVQPRHGSARTLTTPRRFGLCPVRSPLLRESSLFLGVLRCFSSPGSPPVSSGWQAITPAGLPHSEISGSPAASASPEHFVAWPRPSSASSAKASTVCPSFRSHQLRCLPSSPPRSPPGHRDKRVDVLGARRRAGHANDKRLVLHFTHPVGPGWADFHRPIKLSRCIRRWSRGGSNPEPPPCKGGALPVELRPHHLGRWAHLDSNQGPRPYQGRALTS